jgi:hypothetical protein
MSLLDNIASLLQTVAVKGESYAWLKATGRSAGWYPESTFVKDFQFDEKKPNHSKKTNNNGDVTRTILLFLGSEEKEMENLFGHGSTSWTDRFGNVFTCFALEITHKHTFQ